MNSYQDIKILPDFLKILKWPDSGTANAQKQEFG